MTGPGPLVLFGVLGLVGGWSVRPLSIRMGFVEPPVRLAAVAALFFVAAVVGGSAYLTRRVVRRERSALAHHQAVNRLVLGKACALAGALVTGGYLGYALAQLGVGDPASESRLWRSLVAAVAGLALCVAALLLELACRVPPEDDQETTLDSWQ
jgi:hypothetical protein